MKRCAAYLVGLLVIALTFVQVPYAESAEDVMLRHALQPIAGRSVDGIFDYLDRIRPAPVKESDKAFLLRDMMNAGDIVVHDSKQIQKLKERIRGTMALHRRIEVVDLFILKYPYPGAMNRPGAFIAITTKLLELCGNDDAALV